MEFPDYDASAKSTASASLSHGGTVLTARCILLGPITIYSVPNQIGDGLGGAKNLNENPYNFIGWLLFCASSLYESEFKEKTIDRLFDLEISENVFSAFYETVITGIAGAYATQTFPLPEIIKYCKRLTAVLQKKTPDEPDWQIPWTKDQLIGLHNIATNRTQLFSVEIQKPTNLTQSSDQCIVSRNSKKSIGRGDLKFAKDGDMVAIVHGCKLPILLHKEDRGYRVLSGLYVYGFMHGKAIGNTPRRSLISYRNRLHILPETLRSQFIQHMRLRKE
jgi:hypothetical protein